MGYADQVKAVLEPYVGGTAADTCVRATALSVGKSFDTLDGSDTEALRASVRRMLSPIVPNSTLEQILGEMRVA